mgnify:CR=1 FL=1
MTIRSVSAHLSYVHFPPGRSGRLVPGHRSRWTRRSISAGGSAPRSSWFTSPGSESTAGLGAQWMGPGADQGSSSDDSLARALLRRRGGDGSATGLAVRTEPRRGDVVETPREAGGRARSAIVVGRSGVLGGETAGSRYPRAGSGAVPVRSGHHGSAPSPMDRCLVAYDGQLGEQAALSFAARYAEIAEGASRHVLHVADDSGAGHASSADLTAAPLRIPLQLRGPPGHGESVERPWRRRSWSSAPIGALHRHQSGGPGAGWYPPHTEAISAWPPISPCLGPQWMPHRPHLPHHDPSPSFTLMRAASGNGATEQNPGGAGGLDSRPSASSRIFSGGTSTSLRSPTPPATRWPCAARSRRCNRSPGSGKAARGRWSFRFGKYPVKGIRERAPGWKARGRFGPGSGGAIENLELWEGAWSGISRGS